MCGIRKYKPCYPIGDSTKRNGQVWIVSNSYTENNVFMSARTNTSSDQKCYYVKTIPYRWETMLPENEYYYILGIPIPKGHCPGVSEQRRENSAIHPLAGRNGTVVLLP